MPEKLPGAAVVYDPCMPGVDVRADIEKIFEEARTAAARESASDGRSRQVLHLEANWQSVASGSAPQLMIYVHDRVSHSLRKIN